MGTDMVILVRRGTLLDRFFCWLPMWCGHYEAARVGDDTRTWRRFYFWRKK